LREVANIVTPSLLWFGVQIQPCNFLFAYHEGICSAHLP
jgi:hypothetical protein